jgi:phospholipid transport system substrate-binding protein
MKYIFRLLKLSAICVFLIGAPARSSVSETPQAIIQNLTGTLLRAMEQAKSLGYQGRYKMLAPVLTKSFDFSFMIQYAVGNSWKNLSAEQQVALTNAFSRFTIATYARRFNGYSGESFRHLGCASDTAPNAVG